MKKVILALCLIIGLIFIAGCLPITPEEKINIIKVYSDNSIKSIEISKGPLTDQAGEWGEDCTENYVGIFESMIQLAQSAGSEMTDEDKLKMGQLNKIMDGVECSFRKLNGDGELTVSITLDENNINALQALDDESSIGTLKFTDPGDGSIRLEFPVEEPTTDPTLIKEYRIWVEGTLDSMTPAGYTQEGEYYVYQPADVQGKTIKLSMVEIAGPPSDAGRDPPYEPKDDDSLNLILLIVIGIAAVVIIGLIVVLVVKKKKY
ncbi:hypothetical protein ACFL1H_03345 [Nanoarchaeota archaeon]